MGSLKKLANDFQLILKEAAKERFNRLQLGKQFKTNKKQHQSLRRNLDILETNDAKLQGKLNQIRNEFQYSRSKLDQLRQSLENLDLTGADCVSLYEDGSTGYFIGNKEYHAIRTEDGGISLLPMRVHRKKLRNEKSSEISTSDNLREEEEIDNEEDSNDIDDAEEENRLKQFWWES